MKPKLFWLVNLLVVGALLLAACGAPVAPAAGPDGGDQPAASGEKAKVTIFVGFGTGYRPRPGGRAGSSGREVQRVPRRYRG
jgi:hypothetical protein